MWRNAGRFRKSNRDGEVSPTRRKRDRQRTEPVSPVSHNSENDRGENSGPDVMQITRRPRAFGVVVEAAVPGADVVWKDSCRDIGAVQKLWEELAKRAAKLYPKSFWRVLRAVISQSKVTQDKVIEAVLPILDVKTRRLWPKSRSAVDTMLTKNVGAFYPRVIRNLRIDLTHLGLPGLDEAVNFTFIDPIFAWASTANNLSREHPLFFSYNELHHPETGELLYGASVSNGLVMKMACEKIPSGVPNPRGPALIGLSWDASNATKRRSYTPILISVANCDYNGLKACACIAYLPKLNLSKKDSSSPAGHV